MDTLIAIANLVIGFVLLVAGGEFLVRGASSLALAIRISPLVVGLTVVAFGTSAPELAVSVSAAVKGNPDVATGNVLGSNIFNVLLVLGGSALVATLIVNRQLARSDLPLMIGSCGLVWLASLDQKVSRIEGIVGLSLLVLWTTILVRNSRRSGFLAEKSANDELGVQPESRTDGTAGKIPVANRPFPWGLALAMVVFGMVLLLAGANRMVAGAVSIAQMMGVSELVIGLTVVAIGTSLPEMVASLMAAYKGERDLAAGNAVGSNVFNNLAVLGATAVFSPNSIPVSEKSLGLDYPVMFFSSLLCLPMFLSGRITRLQGFGMLVLFALYVTYLILDQSDSLLKVQFGFYAVYVVTPSIVLIMLVSLLWMKRDDNNVGETKQAD